MPTFAPKPIAVIARKTKSDAAIHSFIKITLDCFVVALLAMTMPAFAATGVPFTVTMSEAVNVTGCPANCPRITLDVGGVTRYADYSSGSGTANLTFTYTTQAGDLDLDGITISSNAIDLNTSGTVKDLNGNNLSPLTFTIPNTSAVKVNHPSLSMDFVNSDYILNGLHYATLPLFLSAASGTFTRASVGTYFDSSGVMQTAASGSPRFDHAPVTHTAKGILIEEQRTNLLTYSTRMDNAVWTFSGGTKTTGQPAPDGSTNAALLAGPTIPTTAHRSGVFATSTSMTYSVFAKYASGAPTKIFLLRNQTTVTNFDGCSINIQTGAIVSGCTGWIIIPIGNGWYRISYTRTTGISVGNELIIYYGKTGGSTNADESWIVWGVQLEAGTFATSYIPTTTAAVTRQTDVLTMPTAGWFNDTVGTIYATTTPNYSSSTGTLISDIARIDDLTTSSYERLFLYQDQYGGSSELSNTLQADLQVNSISILANSSYMVAYGYEENNFRSSVNGTLSSLDSSGSVPVSLTMARIGGASPLNGTIDKFKYYPARVSDTQLQLLTQ